MKKLMKIILIVLAVIAALIAVLLIKSWIGLQKPYYKNDYYTDFTSDYALEQKYAGLGAYEVNSVFYASENKTIKKIRIWYPHPQETAGSDARLERHHLDGDD